MRQRFATLQLGAGLVFVATFVVFCMWARFPVPYRDDWDWYLWLLARPLTPWRLLEPHNEHVIPVMRVLLALQYRLEGSGTHLVFAAAVIAQLLVGWMCWREVQRRWGGASFGRFVFGIASVLLFFSFQLQSYVLMAAAVFPLVQMFAIASIVCVLNASEPGGRSRRWWLALALLASTGAALTVTNGLVVPAVVALVAWRRREPRLVVGGFVLAAVAGVAAYLGVLSRLPATAHWTPQPLTAVAAYFLTFFGSGLAYASIGLGLTVGAALFAAGCLVIVATGWADREPTRIELFAASLLAFVIISAAMAAPARAQFGALQAAQSRYATYAMTYWAALLFWGASRAGERAWRAYLRPPLMAATLAATLAAFVLHVFIAFVWRAKADNIATAGLALEAGAADEQWIATLHPITSVVHAGDTLLRHAGDPRSSSARMGMQLQPDQGLAACGGSVTLTSVAGAGGWRAAGLLPTAAAAGVIVDAGGVVRGLARPMPTVALANPQEPQVVDAVWRSLGRRPAGSPEWLGFVGKVGVQPYTLYPTDDDGRPLCRATLDSAEPVHIWLDNPAGPVGDTASGGGWAFQCGGAIERLEVLVDGAERPPVRMAQDGARPDVRASYAGLCDAAAAGFTFELDTRPLAAGRHVVSVRAAGRGGRVVESNSHAIEVR